MDNFGEYIYIIVAVVYFIYNLFFKRKKKKKQRPAPSPSAQPYHQVEREDDRLKPKPVKKPVEIVLDNNTLKKINYDKQTLEKNKEEKQDILNKKNKSYQDFEKKKADRRKRVKLLAEKPNTYEAGFNLKEAIIYQTILERPYK